jgi:Flp pilus assembly protein TadD
MISSENQEFATGLAAFKNGEFLLAIDHLQAALEENPSDWTAKFYLAMCLAQAGETREARFHFMSIRDLCPQAEMRQRASTAVAALNAMKVQKNS